MIANMEKVASARGALVQKILNPAEQLKLAQYLVESVLEDLAPVVDPALCKAEGMLDAAVFAIEEATVYVADLL